MTSNKTDKLLHDMRCEVEYTHVATMPIPLYERIKETLTYEREHSEVLAEALRGVMDSLTASEYEPTDEEWPAGAIARSALAAHEARKGTQDDRD